MTAPAQAAANLAAALGVGGALGVLYAFLSGLRTKHCHLADLLFIVCLFHGWLYLFFGICQGDLRFGYGAGLALGIIGAAWASQRLFGKVFSWLWRTFFHIFGFFLLPVKKFLKKYVDLRKKHLHLAKNGLQ